MADETLRPSAAGDLTQLIPTSGFANWDCVNDITPDGHSTVVTSLGSVGSWRDLYKMPLHSGTGTIYAVEVWFMLSGKGKILIKPNTGGSVYEGDAKSNNGTWYHYYHIWDKNPHTDAQWTWGDIDILQIGCELETTGSKDATNTSDCTQIYVNVITSPYLPILVTDAVTDITSSGVKEHGTLQYKGGFGVTVDKRGFELWRYPSVVIDDAAWTNEQLLLEKDAAFTSCNDGSGQYGSWLEIRLDTARSVTGIAYWKGQYTDSFVKIYVEFYYNSQWNFAFEHDPITPNFINGSWHFEVGMTPHTVERIRFKIAALVPYQAYLYKVLILCDGDDWAETGDFAVESFDHTVAGLASEKPYGVRAQAHNSAGWGWGWWWSQGYTDYRPKLFETLAPPAVGRSHGYIMS